MGYSTETYRVVKDTLEKRRQAALAESDRRRAEIHEKSDEIAEIDRALRKTGLALFRAACEGGKSSDAFIEVMAKNQALQEERGEILRSLGLPADYTEVHYTCPVCRDSGYTDIRMCDCMRRELTKVALRQSGLGSLIDRQSFENFSLQYYAENKENRRKKIYERLHTKAGRHTDRAEAGIFPRRFTSRMGLCRKTDRHLCRTSSVGRYKGR